MENVVAEHDSKIPKGVKFMSGAISGVLAQLVTHPTDVVKLQMQITNDKFIVTIKNVFKKKGPLGFYDGLSAALLRQVTYTMAKLGLYGSLLEIWFKHFGRPNFGQMVGIGTLSGVMGAFIGTPADVVMVRMIGDAKLPQEKRRNYKNVGSAFAEIVKKDGFTALWRGAVPTLGRAAVVSGAQLGSYTRAKFALIDTGYFVDNLLTQFIAAKISGLIACITSLPLDIAKTKIQNWPGSTKPPGMLKMMVITAKAYGFLSLWRGFLAYYVKAGPTTIITMISMEQLQDVYLKMFT